MNKFDIIKLIANWDDKMDAKFFIAKVIMDYSIAMSSEQAAQGAKYDCTVTMAYRLLPDGKFELIDPKISVSRKDIPIEPIFTQEEMEIIERHRVASLDQGFTHEEWNVINRWKDWQKHKPKAALADLIPASKERVLNDAEKAVLQNSLDAEMPYSPDSGYILHN
jgi:hypothetical protein